MHLFKQKFKLNRKQNSIFTHPLLPALVESLGLVHAVSVATVPVVSKVATFVAEVATVTSPPLLKLEKAKINIRKTHF